MFVPIANNLVVIGVLLWFHALVPHPSLATISANHHGLVLLGLGTTLGVVVQALLLIPSLLRSDLHIRFLWQPANEAMRTITRLAGWTFGWVVANQVALVVVLALADGAKIPGAVSSYTYAYTFFQLPYGVVAVSVMTAVTPSLSARWATDDLAAFRHRMAFGLRGILAIIIPSAVGMLILAHPLIDLVLAHGAETSANADSTGGRPGHVRARACPGSAPSSTWSASSSRCRTPGPPFASTSSRTASTSWSALALVGPARSPGSGPLPVHRLHHGRPARPGRGRQPGRAGSVEPT